MNSHHLDFWGRNAAIFISSNSVTDLFIFIKCIKQKPEGIWEKPSSGEGKSIKINLEEMANILEVLKKEAAGWKGFHSYKDDNTLISFKWEDDKYERLWINIGTYSKMLTRAQAKILRILMTHLIEEKIIEGTVKKFKEER